MVETMILQTTWVSDRTSGKTAFLNKIRTSRVGVALKTIWS